MVPLVAGETIQVIANTQIGCTVLNQGLSRQVAHHAAVLDERERHRL
jgi:hypothetical protein